MAILKVVGFDPSLRSWGISAGTLDTITGALSIKTLRVINTAEPKGKQVRQNSHDLSAAKQLMEGVLPFLEHANLIFVEVPVGSQSARAMASYGICVGVLGSIRARGTPFFEVTPIEVKKATVGSKTATKDDMIEWAMSAHPEAPWPLQTIKGVQSVIKGKAEHMADATAAIRAGLLTNEYKQLAAMSR
jgi:Holliday junction resolvasome RuvABC endonuclease subunit